MAFPSTPLELVVELQLGDQWVDITHDVYTREDIVISRGRADEGESVDPGKCSLVLNNRDGRYSPRNPRSPYYGLLGRNTPIRVAVVHNGQRIPRFAGEVSAWPPRWDMSGRDVYVPIEAAGILRRLNGSVSALESALRRYIVAHEPAAYWPLTDGAETQNAAPVVGGNILYLNIREGDREQQMRWASYDIAPWLEPIAQTPEKTIRGLLRGYVSPGHRPRDWCFDFVRAGVGGMDSMTVQIEGAGSDSDPSRFWHLGFDHTQQTLFVSFQTVGDSTSSTTIVQPDFAVPQVFDGDAHVIRFQTRRNPDNANVTWWRVCVDGVQIVTGATNRVARPVVRWRYEWWTPDDQISTTVALGHVTLWDFVTAPQPEEIQLAYHAHSHETAGQRIMRICEEAGIPLTVVGDPDDTQLVGPQEIDTPLANLNSAAQVDAGVLYEDRDEARLVYRTNRSRYNRGRQLGEG